jgi:hypothetical protein
MRAYETIHCQGHPLVRGTHPTTFEVTMDPHLTLQGDCIIGIGANKGAAGLDPSFRTALQRNGTQLCTVLCVESLEVEIHSQGSSRLLLTHPTDLVWRRSSYIDDRTIGIRTDRVAATLPRNLIQRLQQGAPLRVEMTAITLE